MSGYTTGSNNQLTNDGTYSYLYDNEGNRTKRTKTSTGAYTEYSWDYRNRLTKVTEKNSSGAVLSTVDYVYDTFDRRIKKSFDADGPGAGAAVVSLYVYDGDHIALVFDGSNNLKNRFLHGSVVDQILADEQIGGTLLWPLTDDLGTVRDLVNSSGTVQNHLKYDSYGKVTSESNAAVDQLFAFTGRERDEETALQYHRARYLDVGVGRWVNEDPKSFLASDTNLVRYVENGTTFAIDPSGMDRWIMGQAGHRWVVVEDPGRESFPMVVSQASGALTPRNGYHRLDYMPNGFIYNWPLQPSLVPTEKPGRETDTGNNIGPNPFIVCYFESSPEADYALITWWIEQSEKSSLALAPLYIANYWWFNCWTASWWAANYGGTTSDPVKCITMDPWTQQPYHHGPLPRTTPNSPTTPPALPNTPLTKSLRTQSVHSTLED